MARAGITQLQWFFDFLDTDLSHLSPIKLNELSMKLEIIAKRSDVDMAGTGSFTYADIEGFQQRLTEFFGGIVHKIEELKNYQDEKGRPSAEADFYPQFEMLDLDIKVTVRVGSEIPHELPIQDDERQIVRPKPNAIHDAPFELTIHAKSGPEETILFHFIRSFEGVRIGALRQCLECGKWFVHSSKRKREYCTGKCASRKINREKREVMKRKDPKAYEEELKKGRERAAKSYQRKVKKKLPGATVGRRPIKHKND
jgi:hypothetical protein